MLLDQCPADVSLDLAYALKNACYEAWKDEPSRSVDAAEALGDVAQRLPMPEISALAHWTRGIAALIQGRMEESLAQLELAANEFNDIGMQIRAAETQIPKIAVLAMLGQYDEAEACGLRAREIFQHQGNFLASGKINLNLGHLHLRRDQYEQAGRFFQSAYQQLTLAGEEDWTVAAQLSLADACMWQREFQRAEAQYSLVIARSESLGLRTHLATAQLNFGLMEQQRGNFQRALHLLESARRAHEAMDVPYQAATASQFLADAYLGLNMADEALVLYDRAIPFFENEGLRYEQAWMLAHRGHALMLLQRRAEARAALDAARALFFAEDNIICAAKVDVLQAELALSGDDAAAAAQLARAAEGVLTDRASAQWLLTARWVCGDAARMMGDIAGARDILNSVLFDARAQISPVSEQRCLASLGELALSSGDTADAQLHFAAAVELLETQRGMLPSEEFRMAFASNKLTPYTELASIALRAGNPAGAFAAVERARARALLDMLHDRPARRPQPLTAAEDALNERLAALRAELNWCYSQLHERSNLTGRAQAHLVELTARLEAEVRELTLQVQQHGGTAAQGEFQPLNLLQLQHSLADDTALIAYHVDRGEVLAFVVTNNGVEIAPNLGSWSQVEPLVSKLRFQIDALRHGPQQLAAHMPQLIRSTQHYLRLLHDVLLRPVLSGTGSRRLVIVPHRSLHYVPFNALFDGERYAIEAREICIAPSAAVLQHCLGLPQPTWHNALLMGVSDSLTPCVRDEIEALSRLFPNSQQSLDDQATLAALRAHAPMADVVHLACHGNFRPDNPLFSALRLGDGWMTVRDAYELDLRCGLVTLSACETGMSAVAPGDELIGLARGFFAAGAPSLLVSLWRVDDATTAQLMKRFYTALLNGQNPAAALRTAQIATSAEHGHPFFWSAFSLVGRW